MAGTLCTRCNPDYVVAVLASTGQRWQVWQLGAASGKGNGNLNSSVSTRKPLIPPSASTRLPQAPDESSFLVRIYF